MTAKEKLIRDVLDLDEARAARAQIVVAGEPEGERQTVPLPEGWGETLAGEPEMAELPEAWKTFEDGTPVPNWVALLHESRRDR